MAIEAGISVRAVDIDQLIEKLDNTGRKQIPFALSRAVNKLAGKIQAAQKQEALKVFDRPTRWTMNSTYIKWAKKNADPAAEVGWRFFAEKGTPASKYLSRHVLGIERPHTAFESRLLGTGRFYQSQFLVAGRYAPKNQYGNLSQGVLMQILSDTKSQRDERNNRTKASKVNFFAIRQSRGKLKPGVYKRTGDTVKPFFVATDKQPKYKKTYDFYGIGDRIASKDFDTELGKALAYAIATARD